MSRDTANGSAAAWSRLFLSPGMGHCGGGSAALDQFDLLTAVVDWVEKGQAPEAVVATGQVSGAEPAVVRVSEVCGVSGAGRSGGRGEFRL